MIITIAAAAVVVIIIAFLLPHPVVDVVVDDEVQLLVGEAVMLRQDLYLACELAQSDSRTP
jgi:hypothetical protein